MPSESTTSDDLVDVKTETPLIELNTKDELLVSKMPSTESSAEEKWQHLGERASVFINSLPTYVGNFFNKYNRFLGTVGWILAAFASVKLILALLDAVNDIPFLAVILELIGLAYVTWFVYRYLLSAANRQELLGEINTFKKQVLGIGN